MAKTGYVDTSIVLSVVLGESSRSSDQKCLATFDNLWSHSLLESEFLSALKRENIDAAFEHAILHTIALIHPNRSLKTECRKILEYAYLRGADLHHLATALYFFPDPAAAYFLSLDRDQLKAAKQCGFKTSL